MAKILLIRHGEADYAQADARRLKGMGRDLVPLTPDGVKQVEQLAKKLSGRVDLMLSSPMTRALQTAAILGANWRIFPEVEFDLHEWLPDLSCTYDSSRVALTAFAEFRQGNGEWPGKRRASWEQRKSVSDRAQAVLARYAEYPGTVAVVCHGVLIEVLTGRSVKNAEYTEYPQTSSGPASEPDKESGCQSR